ncbi:M1 family aminopeptidase [Myxococcus stipitatus]|uniref:M1 family aminopeptidase n=1 Tax=Myxococcus stipitatus TaxID=83455 RepID=UPI0030D0D613
MRSLPRGSTTAVTQGLALAWSALTLAMGACGPMEAPLLDEDEEGTLSHRYGPLMPQGDFAATVTRYEYEFATQTGAARSVLMLDVAPPGGDCFVVNAPEGLTDLRWNGALPVRAESTPDGIRVCGPGLFAGQVKLEARFIVPLQTYDFTQVGFSRRFDRVGSTFSYLLSWIGACDLLGPCDDRTDQLTQYVFTVKHASNERVLCPGKRTRPNSTTTRCELTGLTKAPTYSSFAVASNPAWRSSTFTEVPGKFKLELHEVPGGKLASALDASEVREYLSWVIGELGPLPYGTELRVASAPTEWLGAEHPANLILREDLPDLRRDYANMTMHTLMHEVVHQWAGNRTTLSRPLDFVWKEAIAEYLTYRYELLARPPGEAQQTRAHWDRLARTASYYPQPQDDPQPVFLSYSADVYGTGPMILFLQLEPLLGEDTVLQAIKDFLHQPGDRSVADLRTALELASGKDLGPYFNAWVHGSGDPDWPFFDVSTESHDGKVTLTAVQRSLSGKSYPVSVDVLIEGATRQRVVTLDYGLAPESDTLRVTVPFPEPVKHVTVDPENRVVNRRFLGLDTEPPPERWRF